MNEPTDRSTRLGIDLGGTNIKYGAISNSGEVLFSGEQPTRIDQAPDSLITQFIEICNDMIAQCHKRELTPLSLGLGTPGVVDITSGTVVSGAINIPGWEGTEIVALLDAELAIPISVDNDANAMALAELELGAGKDSQSALFITVGTGIGGALALAGQIWRGPKSQAGEICNILIDPPTVESSINPTTLEDACSARALLKRYSGLANINMNSVSVSSLAEAWKSGDEQAKQALKETAEIFANPLRNLHQTLDLDRIIMGGGVVDALPALVVEIKNSILYSSEGHLRGLPEIVAATLGNKAGFIGAALLPTKIE